MFINFYHLLGSEIYIFRSICKINEKRLFVQEFGVRSLK